MIFGCIKQQIGMRSNNDLLLQSGVGHFKYCMVHFKDLLYGTKLADIQAMCLLALFARNYQRPESAWFLLHATLWSCVEMKLHRSVSALSESDRAGFTPEDIELRKRVFWCAYSLTVLICGRLGRPIPIQIQNIDVELPKPIADDMSHETALSDFNKCSFHVSLSGNRMSTLMAQVHSKMYCVQKNSNTYQTDVAQLEQEFEAWQSAIPAEFADPSNTEFRNKPSALYIHCWGLEFKFFLHHPVLRHSITGQYDEENLAQSLQLSTELLHATNALQDANCLDVQWLNMAFIVAVVSTTLFVYKVRKDQNTREELDKLKTEMMQWETIFYNASRMLGKLLYPFFLLCWPANRFLRR
jgi:hypothetical protein